MQGGTVFQPVGNIELGKVVLTVVIRSRTSYVESLYRAIINNWRNIGLFHLVDAESTGAKGRWLGELRVRVRFNHSKSRRLDPGDKTSV